MFNLGKLGTAPLAAGRVCGIVGRLRGAM